MARLKPLARWEVMTVRGGGVTRDDEGRGKSRRGITRLTMKEATRRLRRTSNALQLRSSTEVLRKGFRKVKERVEERKQTVKLQDEALVEQAGSSTLAVTARNETVRFRKNNH